MLDSIYYLFESEKRKYYMKSIIKWLLVSVVLLFLSLSACKNNSEQQTSGEQTELNEAVDSNKPVEADYKLDFNIPYAEDTIDRILVRNIVKQRIGDLRVCYAKGVEKNSSLGGKIGVRWVLEPKGIVSGAVLTSSTLNDRDVEDCMVNAIRKWTFPPLQTDVPAQIDFPFEFERGGF